MDHCSSRAWRHCPAGRKGARANPKHWQSGHRIRRQSVGSNRSASKRAAPMILQDQEMAAWSGGQLIQPGPAGPISTDSRRIKPGDWFLALVGERFVRMTSTGRAAGCAGVIAQRVPAGWKRGSFRFPNPYWRYKRLLREHERACLCP